VSLDERPRGSTRPTPKVHYNSLPRTSIEGALGNRVNKRPGSKEMRSYSTNVGLPFLIIHTAGDDRKLPLPAFLVILPAVPLYSVMRRTYVKMSCPLSKPSTNILNES
jgi:hypothetical protein